DNFQSPPVRRLALLPCSRIRPRHRPASSAMKSAFLREPSTHALRSHHNPQNARAPAQMRGRCFESVKLSWNFVALVRVVLAESGGLCHCNDRNHGPVCNRKNRRPPVTGDVRLISPAPFVTAPVEDCQKTGGEKLVALASAELPTAAGHDKTTLAPNCRRFSLGKSS